ncbi:protein of unknown function (plasmid) [Cupriavidus taiwanensis]|uniref:Uncharacterized protein n=1 Tax=Cupriavidus taiwanensis TaxID=164546 RepID=A0A375ISF4_9BURK|nr:protein of unknown function [Cupriavidus taiwanensis]
MRHNNVRNRFGAEGGRCLRGRSVLVKRIKTLIHDAISRQGTGGRSLYALTPRHGYFISFFDGWAPARVNSAPYQGVVCSINWSKYKFLPRILDICPLSPIPPPS